jgi:hypothetical protein
MGCFDVYQHITKENNGNVNMYFKIAMSKAFLNMGNGSNSNNNQPVTNPFADFQNNPIMTDVKELGATVSEIDTEKEFGVVIRMSLDMKSKDVQQAMSSQGSPLIPQISDSGITIFFPSQGSPTGQDQSSKAIMTAFKYRLSIGKALMPTISKVILRTGDAEVSCEAIDLSDIYMIEIPMSDVFGSEKSQLVILK